MVLLKKMRSAGPEDVFHVRKIASLFAGFIELYFYES